MSDALAARLHRLAAVCAEDGLDRAEVESHLPRPFEASRCAASYTQRQLWFVEQLQQSSGAYNVSMLRRLTGSLDIDALEAALRAIARRHEILRTRIVNEAGVPVQVIGAAPELTLPVVHVDAGTNAVADYLAAAAPLVNVRLDMAAAPPWGTTLLRRGPDDHCLVALFHHAIFDGGSARVFLDELAAAYAAHARGGAEPAELPLQFAEFAAWQLVREATGRIDADIDFWTKRLTGVPEQIDLGGDRRRPAEPTFRGGIIRMPLDRDVVGRLSDVAARCEATKFAAGLAAWAGWLAERSGQTDIVVGSVSAGRTRRAFVPLIGALVNTLMLRLDVADAPTFGDLVRQARRVTVEAVAHEHAPIERIFEQVRTTRTLGRTPLAQAAFVRQFVAQLPDLPGIDASRLLLEPRGEKTDLSMSLDSLDANWGLSLEYSTDVFSADAAQAALTDFARFLASAVRRPDARRGRGRAYGDAAATPLTSAQSRVWIDQQKTPDAPLYNVAVAIEMRGALDVAAFDRAFARLVETTDALRLSFAADEGVPMQRVREDIRGSLPRIDLTGASPADRAAWLHRMATERFDLGGPLFRSALVGCGADLHIWVLVQHHLVTDGWSVTRLCNRLTELYVEERGGEVAQAAWPSFIDCVRERPPARCFDDWWLARFEEVDRPRWFGERIEKRSTAVTRTAVVFDPERCAGLRAAAAGLEPHAATRGEFLVCGAALVAYLHRLTGEPRIAIGVPVHNRRTRAERAGAGLFMDVVPILVECSRDDTFTTLVPRLATALRASLKRGVPPVCVRERTCDVLLNVQNPLLDELCGTHARLEWIHTGHERESLSVQLQDFGADGIRLDLDTHDEVFGVRAGAETERFLRILDACIAEVLGATSGSAARTPISAVALVDSSERERIHAASIGLTVPAALLSSVLDGIFDRAARSPDACAIEAAGRCVSYAELADAALRVAAGLRGWGAQPGDLVGVCLDRRPEFVFTILGVLAMGGAYLPIDPASPPARRSELAADGGARLVVVDAESDGAAGLVTIQQLLASPPAANRRETTGDDLAYVVYTSGSTGTPKGVEVRHQGLSNYTAYAQARFSLTPADRVLQFAALTFDTAFEEIFPTLAAGATLVLRDAAMVSSPDAFVARVAAERISVVDLPTSFWHALVLASASLPCCVRLVLVGGEAVRPDLLSRWQRAVGSSIQLLNGYGPSEATIVATFADLTHAETGRAVAIGSPIWNAETYVVDGAGQLAPDGWAGQLLIGGAGVARGYRGDPELTAARFIAHPFEAGARVYATGDWVRRGSDGSLEFLGRVDDQVKIRGFRVEPAEVAARLRSHAGVADAAVVPVASTNGTRLAAYVVRVPGSSLSARELRGHLRTTLPDYMVPSELFECGALPRTASGKLERTALAAAARSLESADDGPRTETERTLAEIWSALVRRARIGVHDNFFELGGHSLLATQLTARVSSHFGIELPLRRVFECPTLLALAGVVDALRDARSDKRAESAAVLDEDGTVPMSHGQRQLWLAEQLTPGSHRYTMGRVLRLRGALDAAALQHALDRIVERHAALRTTLAQNGDQGIQIIHPPAPVRVEVHDAGSEDPTSSAQTLAARVLEVPFDLASGPLVRAALIRLRDDEHWLALAFHHAIFDGWSAHIFVEEFTAFYDAARRGTPEAVPPAGASYARFARWQQQALLAGSTRDELVDFWRRTLQDAPPLRLPVDATGDPDALAAAVVRTTLEGDAFDAVHALARALDATPFIVSAAAFALVLGRIAGQDDVVFGTPVAGRSRPEFERTIGFFVNTLPFRLDLSGHPTVGEFVGRVRDRALALYAHQDLPFEQIVDHVAPDRAARRHPFFEVVLNFVSTPDCPLSVDGLEIEPLPPGVPEAKFDLNLYATPSDRSIAFVAVHRRSRFSAARVAAMLDQVVAVLRQMAADPAAPLSAISLMTPASRAVLPDPTARIEPVRFDPVPVQFARMLKQHAAALAIDDGGDRWTYAELGAAASSIQQTLAAAGLRPGDRVAIVGRPGAAFVAAMLAAISDGFVVVPIDDTIAAERIEIMRREAAARATLSIGPSQPAGEQSIAIDPNTLPRTGPGVRVALAGDAAYVYFTSGTTGVPKGVVGSHQGLAQFLAWQRETLAFRPEDRVAQVTSPSFDPFLRECLLPLTSGGSLQIPPANLVTTGRLLEWLDRSRSTIVHVVPTVAQFWLDEAPATVCRSLRCVVFNGEPLTATLAARWRATAPSARVLNFYGPTETTLIKCWYETRGDERDDVLPVGRPIPGAQALVVDGTRLCGIGEPGEILIRTPYRSLGYLNPRDAIDRFVTNPFTTDPTDIVYRTGDRGRYRPDGMLTVDGRIAHAVKIRGVFVNPVEVAAVLGLHRRVRGAAVAVDDSGAAPSLVACLAVSEAIPTAELRRLIQGRLHPAAVPGRFVFVDELPRGPNGKVDIRAIRALRGTEATPNEPLATVTEAAVGLLWHELLGDPPGGRQADFFDAGGHSLAAARLVARIRERFGVELPIRTIFDAPTLAGIAAAVDEAKPSVDAPSPIPRADRRRFRAAADGPNVSPASV